MRVADGIVEEARQILKLVSYLGSEDEIAGLTEGELNRFISAEATVRNMRAGMRVLASKLRPLYDEVKGRKEVEALAFSVSLTR